MLNALSTTHVLNKPNKVLTPKLLYYFHDSKKLTIIIFLTDF